MDPPSNLQRRVLGTLCYRLTMKKTFLLLLLPAVLLLYFSLEASRSLLTAGSPHFSKLFYHQDPPRNTESPSGGKIILMTYGRSGSSFTSEIIQQDPSVFYTFEPLYNVIRRYIGKKTGRSKVAFPNDTAAMEAYDKESIEVMEVFLTCGFESMNPEDINNFQLRNSVDSRLLWGCVQKRGNWTPVGAVDCFLKARRTCLERPVKMVKSIRLRGTAARAMLDKYPDLKILYLIRDPRGTITSQKRVFSNFKWEDIANFSRTYCQTFREDLSAMGEAMDKYPQRVKLLRYERMAENPLKEAEAMYKFLGLEFTPRVREFVFNKTMAGQKGNNAFSTSRQNSTATAYSWRTKITLSAAQTIDRNCEDVYKHLGYFPVHSLPELVNFGHTLRKNVNFHGQEL